jgi:hypothetical protein
MGRRWARGTVDAPTFADECVGTLRRQVATTGDDFGLRVAMLDAGRRLVDILDVVDRHGLKAIIDLEDVHPEEREERFIRAIADRVVYPGVLPADSAARWAAVESALRILDEPNVKRAVREADSASGLVSDDLFCKVYRFFFGAVLAGFLTTVFTAKIIVAAPVLPALPGGAGAVLAKWMAERALDVVLSPCAKQAEPGNEQRPVVALGRELLAESVRRVLGIGADSAPALGTAA